MLLFTPTNTRPLSGKSYPERSGWEPTESKSSWTRTWKTANSKSSRKEAGESRLNRRVPSLGHFGSGDTQEDKRHRRNTNACYCFALRVFFSRISTGCKLHNALTSLLHPSNELHNAFLFSGTQSNPISAYLGQSGPIWANLGQPRLSAHMLWNTPCSLRVFCSHPAKCNICSRLFCTQT